MIKPKNLAALLLLGIGIGLSLHAWEAYFHGDGPGQVIPDALIAAIFLIAAAIMTLEPRR